MKKCHYYIAGLLLVAAYYAVQFLGPAWIRFLVDQGQFGLLNQLTLSSANQHPGFYLGRGEELVWGPVLQVISGAILILIALGPLKAVSARGYFLVIFVFLLMTKWNVLAFPPYGDSIGGPFAEGWWLAQHNFDYVGLFHQPGYAIGGPKVYQTSLFPTYLAVLYKLCPSIKAFLAVNHLIFFAMAAGVVTLVRAIGRRVFSVEVAGLAAALVLSWPVFQTQLEAGNMELPSLFFAMICAFALVRGQINAAGIAALLSLLAKGSGVFACAAFFCCGLLALIGETKTRRRIAWIVWGLGLMGMAALAVAVKFWVGDQHASAGMIKFMAGWPSLKTFPITYVYLVNIGLLFLVWLFWPQKFAGQEQRDSQRINHIMLIFAGMWFLLFLNFYVVCPRYRLAVYPFYLFTLVWTFAQFCSRQVWQAVVLAGAVLLVQYNSYGWRGSEIPRDYVLLEENLQYRNDLKLYQDLAAAIETKYAGATVVAPFIVAQALAIRDFGFVTRPQDVVIYGFDCKYGRIREYEGLGSLNMARTIYTSLEADQGIKGLPYPINPDDKVLEVLEWGDRKAWIFMGGISIDFMWKMQNYQRLQRLKEAQGVI
ncbi:MAG: hypothetical protein HQL22_04730 [Candidatus Omnitrophica bacterium]|nr:hypothetical protein [Candidatus Omnitrophota bacterium]